MEELYNISRVLFFHHECTGHIETDNWVGSSTEDPTFEKHIIDTNKFKELLLSMPQEDYIENYHESFKISKDANSLRISIFWFYKRTQLIRGKHQLEKQLKVTRYIIKRHKNNFYVTKESFSQRKRKNSLVQNYIRQVDINDMINKLLSIIFRNEFGENAGQVTLFTESEGKSPTFSLKDAPWETGIPLTPFIISELNKIKTILSDELDVPITARYGRLQPKTYKDVVKSLRVFFAGAILEWFYRKNNIKLKHFWLIKLMAQQYFTKPELLKCDNDYLKTYLDFYQLTPNAVRFIKENLSIILERKFFCQSLSLYERLFDIYEFNGIVTGFIFFLQPAFVIQNPKDRLEYGVFLSDLEKYKIYFTEYFTSPEEYAFNQSELQGRNIIESAALLYWINVGIDFTKIKEIAENVDDFMTQFMSLLTSRNEYVIQIYAPKYKQKIEKKFIKYGQKWQIKLYHKNEMGLSLESMMKNIGAYLQNNDTNHIIKLDIEYTQPQNKVTLKANVDDVVTYLEETSGLKMKYSHIKIIRNEISQITGGKIETPRKKPNNTLNEIKCVLQHVHNIFYRNARYFQVDNHILLPILQEKISQSEILNKYLHIKS